MTHAEEQTWTGTVRRGTVGAKSMDAWNGAEHVLEADDGARVVLRASAHVSAEALEALVGRRITLHGVRLPDEPVHINAEEPQQAMMMQYPVASFSPGGPSGPAPRSGGVSVQRVEPLD